MTPSRASVHGFPHSAAFGAEILRSERQRVGWFLVFLLTTLGFVALRNLAFFRGQHLLRVALPIALAAIVVELGQLWWLERARRRGRPLPAGLWAATTVFEALLPTVLILVTVYVSPFGPVAALVSPNLSIYFFAILLTTLHLRPALCYLAGIIAAGGYLLAVAHVYGRFAGQQLADALHPSIPVTFAVGIMLTAAAAASVAAQLRRRLLVALAEADRRRRAELKGRDALIFALAKMAECRDTDTGEHLERIAAYSAVLAEALPAAAALGEAWREQLRIASTLHDIGKVGLPDAVLKKPGPLTPEERTVMQAHPQVGADALRAIEQRHGRDPLLDLGVDIAGAHHERWDGGGYPGRLRGSGIPLAARIVAVADVYDALTAERVYKPPMPHADAAAAIESGSGTQFDPEVVTAFRDRAAEFDAIRQSFARG